MTKHITLQSLFQFAILCIFFFLGPKFLIEEIDDDQKELGKSTPASNSSRNQQNQIRTRKRWLRQPHIRTVSARDVLLPRVRHDDRVQLHQCQEALRRVQRLLWHLQVHLLRHHRHRHLHSPGNHGFLRRAYHEQRLARKPKKMIKTNFSRDLGRSDGLFASVWESLETSSEFRSSSFPRRCAVHR